MKLKPRHRKIIELVRDSKFKILIAVFCMLLMSASKAAIAYLIKPALDDVFIKQDETMLFLIPLAVIIVYMVQGVGMFGQSYMMSYVGQNIIRRLRNMLYNHLQDLPLSFFQKQKTGVLISRVTYDVAIVRAMVTNVVTGSLRDAFTIIGLIVVIFYQIWQLALFAFIILPIAFYPIVFFGRRVRRISRGNQETMADMSSFLQETFVGSKIVKAFHAEEYEKARFSDKTRKLFRIQMKEAMVHSISSPVMELLAGFGIAFVVWFGGSRVISGAYTTGTFLSFLGAVIMLYDPVKKLSKLNNALQQGLAATDRIFDILEETSDILETPCPVEIPDGEHSVRFEHVSFKYDRDMVLKDINLEVKPGEIFALVGMSGGGKTSLVNLIPRFYDVTQGAVYLDDIDIRDASLRSLRRQIAVVTQEPILFNDTVRGNIAYGRPDATPEDIESSARSAYAFDFIDQLPDGLDTVIGEMGNRLSGGQRQRICIARALLKNAPILILDEATSSLDTESEYLVQKALDNLMKGRTTFVIAHRLSTVSSADHIVVLVDGEIVEQGTHAHLISCAGAYCKLYQMQFADQNGETT